MATVRPGQTLGEMTLVDEWTRSGTAIAVTEVQLIGLTRAGYDHLCEQHPAIALRLMTQFARIISQRLRRASKALVEP
jgi:CRP-like cAMP-binding protein